MRAQKLLATHLASVCHHHNREICNLFSLITFLDFKPNPMASTEKVHLLTWVEPSPWNHIYRNIHLVSLFRSKNFLRPIYSFSSSKSGCSGFCPEGPPPSCHFRSGLSLILPLSLQVLVLTVNFFMPLFSSNYAFCVSLCPICSFTY